MAILTKYSDEKSEERMKLQLKIQQTTLDEGEETNYEHLEHEKSPKLIHHKGNKLLKTWNTKSKVIFEACGCKDIEL